MASLKVVSDRLDDNALKVAVVIPPCRNGAPNFSILAALIADVHRLNPDAFDASVPAPVIAHNDGHTADGGGIIPESTARAMLRDGVVPPDDDEGEPIPGYRCANGACVGD